MGIIIDFQDSILFVRSMTPNMTPWNILNVTEKQTENHESISFLYILAFMPKSIDSGAVSETFLYSFLYILSCHRKYPSSPQKETQGKYAR